MSDVELTFQVEPGTQEVVLTRTFAAPRELVFRTYTDPQLVPKWWGPRTLTTNVVTSEVRSGGSWRFVQHDPEGREHAFHGVYHEVSSPSRLVNTFEYEGAPERVLLEITTFEEVSKGTRMTTHSVFQTAQDRDQMVASGMEWGVRESVERLTELLAGEL
jgi:uncharacterized protein YndB with AHSA1/START domain